MTLEGLLRELEGRGFTLSLRDGTPRLTGDRSRLTPEISVALSAFRAGIIARLESPPPEPERPAETHGPFQPTRTAYDSGAPVVEWRWPCGTEQSERDLFADGDPTLTLGPPAWWRFEGESDDQWKEYPSYGRDGTAGGEVPRPRLEAGAGEAGPAPQGGPGVERLLPGPRGQQPVAGNLFDA